MYDCEIRVDAANRKIINYSSRTQSYTFREPDQRAELVNEPSSGHDQMETSTVKRSTTLFFQFTGITAYLKFLITLKTNKNQLHILKRNQSLSYTDNCSFNDICTWIYLYAPVNIDPPQLALYEIRLLLEASFLLHSKLLMCYTFLATILICKTNFSYINSNQIY